jgi:sigma-B regulation protein RsbU (phosphoserine phosphatase)
MSRRKAKPGSLSTRLREFLQASTEGVAGVEPRGLGRALDRDARRAFRVLVGERPQLSGRGKEGDLHEILERVRLLFLGIVRRLTPPRRAVFVASFLALAIGMFGDWSISRQGFSFDGSPFLLALAFSGVTFLLVVELVERVLVRDELQVARQLQRELLPAQPPVLAGYEIAQAWGTANEIGGDYFHFAPLPDGRWAIAVADASGHGMAAGLLMALSDATLRTALDLAADPLTAAESIHRRLIHTGDRRAFLTLFLGVLEPATGNIESVVAGHPFPVLRRADGALEEIGRGGFPLGVREEIRLEREATRLAPGDTLVLYTDGIPEAIDATGGAFGFDRLRELTVAGGTAVSILERVLREHERHRGEEPLNDDWTLVVIRRLGPGDQQPPPTPPPPPRV